MRVLRRNVMLDMRVPVQEIQLLKSDDLVVAGYASVELVDKQGDLITREALKDAFKKYFIEMRIIREIYVPNKIINLVLK